MSANAGFWLLLVFVTSIGLFGMWNINEQQRSLNENCKDTGFTVMTRNGLTKVYDCNQEKKDAS